MTYKKWNSSGKLTWSDGDILDADDLNDTIDEVFIPIGGIVAWFKGLEGVPQTLPEGWVVCDGSTINDPDSPLNGKTLPNLVGKFLRGNSTSGGTGGADTHSHSLSTANTYSSEIGASRKTYEQNTQSASSLPPYYEVVWIMRIK